jgi:hypothetical protein
MPLTQRTLQPFTELQNHIYSYASFERSLHILGTNINDPETGQMGERPDKAGDKMPTAVLLSPAIGFSAGET